MRRRHALHLTTACVMVAVSTVSMRAAVDADSTTADSDRHVTVEVVSSQPGDLAAAAAVTAASGGNVRGQAPGILLVDLPRHALDRLSEVVDGEVRTPVPVDVGRQTLGADHRLGALAPLSTAPAAVTNADAWHDAGFDGSGVKIGVIDFFETDPHWNVAEHGPLPVAGVSALCLDQGDDCTAEFFDGVDPGGADRHGVAVVELIRDIAPGAEILIGQASTLSDYQALVDWFVSRGVQIVNRSLGSRFDGPGDGRGPLGEIAADAASRGILWVNSGGNNGQDHYYRHPVRLIGDRVAFGEGGTETFLQFTNCVALGGVRWANDWDKPANERTDYDVYLWESPTGDPAGGTVIASSLRNQRAGAEPIELLLDDGCPDPGSSLYLQVRWVGGDIAGDVLEILDYGGGFTAHTQSAYSAAVSIVDSDQHGVIAVGAIDPPTGGVVAPYSSNGPTNDGRLAPDLTAPSGFANSVYGGRLSGTSAASAVVAGGAAVLLDAGLAARTDSLGDLLRNLTIDRGARGPDDVYGHGEFHLPAPPDPAGIDGTPSQFTSLDVPTRFLDTRPGSAIGPTDLIGKTWAGEIVELPVAGIGVIPAEGVSAVVANVVTVEPDQVSYLQVLPTRQAALGGFSNLNTDAAGQTRANLAVVPVGDDGSISIYSVASGHLVVDVLGWFGPTDGPVSGGRFVALPDAQRLLDTRVDPPAVPLASGAVRVVPMPTGIDPAQIAGLVLTVTSTEATDPGWLQAYPAARSDVVGLTSTLNIAAGNTVANAAIVPTEGGGVAITGYFADGGSSHVVVDAIGYMTTATAPARASGRFVPVQPGRAYDSRPADRPLADRQTIVVDASSAPGVTVPDSAGGVIWNVAIVAATRLGYLTGWAADHPQPPTSSLNWTLPGEIRASAVFTDVDDGRARFRVEDGSADLPWPVGHVIVDVFGYFT